MQLFIDLKFEIDNIKIMIAQNEILSQIENDITALRNFQNPEKMRADLDKLNEQAADENLWNDANAARKLLQKKSSLEKSLADFESLETDFKNLNELYKMAPDDPDVTAAIESLAKRTNDAKFVTLFSGANDNNNAFLFIQAGAGGTEAMDWAQMLARMYSRWVERHGFSIEVIDEHPGDVAGLKSITFKIDGENAYGWLKSEIGVHRLVRISPFNANGKRQTSFASVDVWPDIDDAIEIEINEKDLRIDTYRSSGAGGQHVNKTDSAVRITHIPTNTVVTCQNERSQFQNKDMAMKILRSRLYELELKKREAEENAALAAQKKIEWGSQIRNYVLYPYQLVKDVRTNVEKTDSNAVLDGDLDEFMLAYLQQFK